MKIENLFNNVKNYEFNFKRYYKFVRLIIIYTKEIKDENLFGKWKTRKFCISKINKIE